MTQLHKVGISLGLIGILIAGCGPTHQTYVRSDAAWGTIQKVAVLPISIPSENVIRQEQITQIFATELRHIGLQEVIEVESDSLFGILPSLEEIGKNYEVDGVFSGSVDQMDGGTVQLQLFDAATGDLVWSASYLMGNKLSMQTMRQKLQRIFRALVHKFKAQVHSRLRITPLTLTTQQ